MQECFGPQQGDAFLYLHFGPGSNCSSACNREVQEDEASGSGRGGNLSKHERQQQRMQERIARLEAQNMADKDWFMQGEAGAGQHSFPCYDTCTLFCHARRGWCRSALFPAVLTHAHCFAMQGEACAGQHSCQLLFGPFPFHRMSFAPAKCRNATSSNPLSSSP